MALHWTIDSRTKLLVAVADCAVALSDLDRLLDIVVGARIVDYRKLFDGRLGEARMGETELLSVGVRLRSLHAAAGAGLGPLALVVRDENYWRVARVLGILAVPKRPMRVFKESEKARAWLDSPVVMSSVPG